MFVIVSYDVSETNTKEGARRLRTVAQICQDYGQRVQYSVFECNVSETEWAKLKTRLLSVYDQKKDSLRFYNLGLNKGRIEHFGVKASIDFEGPLIM